MFALGPVQEIQLDFCIEALRAELWRERLLVSVIRRNSEILVEFNAKKNSENVYYLCIHYCHSIFIMYI